MATIYRAPEDQLTTARALTATTLFSELEPEELVELAAKCERIRLEAGDTLLSEGEPGDCFYVALSGRLQVTQRQPDGTGELVLGDVLPGEHVGEAALLENAPRMATVRAVTEGELVALSRDALEGFLDRHPDVRSTLVAALRYRLIWAAVRRYRPPQSEIISALAQFTGDLDRTVLEMLEGEVQWTTLPRGALLMKQGQPGDCLYLVVSGRLRVFAQRDDGSEVRIAEIGPGESVGEMALLSGDLRSANVEALRDSELLRLSKTGFDRLVAQHPKAMAIFTRFLAERLERTIRARTLIVQLRATPLVTVEECDDVSRTEDLVLRNLKITQTYYRLSLELTVLLGQQDANWCTFACNASKTAGYAIRKEQLPMFSVLRSLNRVRALRRPTARLQSAAEHALFLTDSEGWLDAVSDEVSRHISTGNLKVFAELAPIFARFIRSFHQDDEYDGAKLERWLGSLRRGPTEAGGQDTLIEALSHYYEATFEPRPKAKAELILLGNIKVGLHEQIRLQPEILRALNAPAELGPAQRLHLLSERWLARARDPGAGLPLRLARRLDGPIERAGDRLLDSWAAFGRRWVTRTLMQLRLPYGGIRLGADLPVLPSQRPFPDMLETLEHPELVRLVRAYHRDVDTLRGTRALDWARLDDRMSFIVYLFRSRQKSLELFDQPFLMAQRQAMQANRVPSGPL
jgi:CRP-like cAMP-binding protein